MRPSERISLTSTLKRLGNAGFERVVASHDRLVHLGAAGDVVRLHRQHLLQGVGRAVRFERPPLHFTETLAAELGLAAQGLLGDQAVGADRPGMDLVVDEMVELEHVDVADRHLAVELVAGASVVQRDLAGVIEAGEIEHLARCRLRLRSVKHRRRDRHAVPQVLAEFEQAVLVERLDGLVLAVHLLQDVLERLELLARPL